MLKAAIDLGTNSLRAIIGEINALGSLEIIEEQIFLTRIGEKINETRHIQPEAWKRTIEALKSIKQLFDKYALASYKFVATSALRDAENGEEFSQEVSSLGLNMQVISGLEEAKVIAKAVNHFIPEVSNSSLFADQGGGSIEFIKHFRNHKNEIEETYNSLDLGIVRLTEMFFSSVPPSKAEIASFEHFFTQGIQTHVVDKNFSPNQLIVLGGTGTTMARLKLNLAEFDSKIIHCTKISYDFVKKYYTDLAELSVNEIALNYNLDAKRADVIMAGTLQVKILLELFELEEFVVSDRGLRYGLLL